LGQFLCHLYIHKNRRKKQPNLAKKAVVLAKNGQNGRKEKLVESGFGPFQLIQAHLPI